MNVVGLACLIVLGVCQQSMLTLELEIYYEVFGSSENLSLDALARVSLPDGEMPDVGDHVFVGLTRQATTFAYEYLSSAPEVGRHFDGTVLGFTEDRSMVFVRPALLPESIPPEMHALVEFQPDETKLINVYLTLEDDGTLRYQGFDVATVVARPPVMFK